MAYRLKPKTKQSTPINYFIEGQLNIFDMGITKIDKKVTEIVEIDTKVINSPPKTELLITVEQENKYRKYLAVGNVSRAIKHCCGELLIEIKKTTGEFTTDCISKKGDLECSFSKRAPLLPLDTIIYHNAAEIKSTITQTDKLHELLCSSRDSIKRVIKRKGDLNILVEMVDKVVSILPCGWSLNFTDVNEINCNQDEIFLIIEKLEKPKQENLLELQNSVNVGDNVEAWYGKEIIKGEIVLVYGSNNAILNINFDNNTKQTAIGRRTIRKMIEARIG